MSTVQDEAEVGRVQSTNDEESEADRGPENDENRTVGGNPVRTLRRPYEEEKGEEEEEDKSLNAAGTSFRSHERHDLDMQEDSSLASSPALGRPSSADGSLSIPDDTPSIQDSKASSPSRRARLSSYGRSPTPSLRPFDRRFQARTSPSPLDSPRATSPAFLNPHSRQSSLLSQTVRDVGDLEPSQAPWEVVRWTKLRKMTGQAFSEIGKRNFGRATCIAVSATIALGTSKGLILVFDYTQNLKSIIGLGTKAVESGAVTSISVSADHTIVAGGHASGNIFTWDIAKPAKPFLHITPVDRRRSIETDGHGFEVPVLHIGFLGTRHTALVSADDKGMAFSHLATRGLGSVSRNVRTTRILGRYPDDTPGAIRQRKPSAVLAFSPLPLGNAEHASDTIGLVAMLTPYLLVIVSTTPIAQTQYKTSRPKEVAAHGAMSAALAWFPSVKLKTQNLATSETSSRVKLAYCWSNILTILEVVEVEPSESSGKGAPASLQFRPRSRWKADEAIVGLQWLSRSVLAVLTITQQLVILEESSLQVTDSSDLIQRHIYHVDLFSQQLNQLVDQLDGEDASMHGVVADAFYMSFRAYKGRLFLLGYNEISFGTLSNWADRLLALMEQGNFIGAIQLATAYYDGEADKVTVGLPEDDPARHNLVREKLLEMMSASLKYAFGKNVEARTRQVEQAELEELANACFAACISMGETDFLFEDTYSWYQGGEAEGIFLETLEPHIIAGEIEVVPPSVLKDLISHYRDKDLEKRLEEMICNLDSRTMDIDQITSLCKENNLYDALLYVWNQALGDYTTLLLGLLDMTRQSNGVHSHPEASFTDENNKNAAKMFPYLSYILTSRIYPTGRQMSEDKALVAKAEIYHFFFSGRSHGFPSQTHNTATTTTFRNLRKILDYDAPSFLSMLNEAFEDAFLNGSHDRVIEETAGQLTKEQTFGLSVNRQWIVSILLEVMTPPNYEPEDSVYLDMFIARNLPKFPQFILLPGHVLHRVLVGLCNFSEEDVAEDCQLSVEYLLSMYQPPDLPSLIPLITKARFYRVLKSIYRADGQYARLLQTCFDDYQNPDAVFDCIGDCLRPRVGLSETQAKDVKAVIILRAHDLVATDVTKAASTIEEYAPELHGVLLDALDRDEASQFQYLQTVLEPSEQSAEDKRVLQRTPNRSFVEQYVRLLCDYDPRHVSEYVEKLKTGDLRLEEVLPALEKSDVIDAAVVLLARDGKVREAIDRLTRHLSTMEAALLGLFEGASVSPDAANTQEFAHHLVESIQKYTRIGIWLCQGQTKSAQRSKGQLKQIKRSKSRSVSEELSLDENLWLDLIDAVVAVTKNINEILEDEKMSSTERDGGSTVALKYTASILDSSKLIQVLRKTVQETFTALLATTSAPRTDDLRRQDGSFLRILRAFLSRASLSSPSLSNLRAVLATIFSAYAYEESLLALANRLLDKDLFVHVTEADHLRRRGWRPLGQVCEGCGRRVWGPGAGSYIWDAWQRRNEERSEMAQQRQAVRAAENHATAASQGKGKGAMSDRKGGRASSSQDLEFGSGNTPAVEAGVDVANDRAEDLGSLVAFSCRHIFHRKCLQEMQGPQGAGRASEASGVEYSCPLCTNT